MKLASVTDYKIHFLGDWSRLTENMSSRGEVAILVEPKIEENVRFHEKAKYF